MNDPDVLPPVAAKRSNRTRNAIGALAVAAVLAGGVTAFVVLRDDDDTSRTETSGGSDAESNTGAAAAAQARARRESFVNNARALQAPLAEAASTADAMSSDLGMCAPDDWQPTAEDIAAANADADALASTFDTYGIAYTVEEDDFGFRSVTYDYTDAIAESVASSFWNNRYPPEPIPAEELDRIRAENDGLAARFDNAGIAYTRETDDLGYEWLEWDYEDPDAQTVADTYYNELYPPEPIPAEELDRIRAENDGLAARFDNAGIAYTRETDDLGYEWLEWDYEDPDAQTVADAYYTELYPPIECGDVLPVEPGIGVAEPGIGVAEPVEAVEVDTVGVDPVEPAQGIEVEPAEPLPAEELDRMLEEVNGLAAAFDDAGIAYTRESDESGWQWLEWDYEDSEAQAIADAFYTDFYAPDPELVAARAARVGALTSAFDDAGIAYNVEGEADWTYVLFDIDDPAAPAAVATALAG